MVNPEEKKKFEIFCTKCYVPIFSQPWWMDAVCGENNWGVHVIEQSGQYIAAMPYYVENRNGFEIITKAHHTQNNGIIINYKKDAKYCSRLDMDERVINEMCDYIESLNVDKYEQQYHYSFTNYLPFKWRDYSEMVRYTYVIEDTSDMEKVEADFHFKIRNHLKNAEKLLTVKEGLDIKTFYDVNKLSYDRQGIEVPFSRQLLDRIDEACTRKECRKVLYAVDEKDNIVSVAYLVWDKESVYYLISGSNPAFRSSQANALLIRESIRLAHNLKKKFDFEGSVIQSIERSFRDFGGKQKLYFRIYKSFNPDMDEKLVNSWAKDAPVF